MRKTIMMAAIAGLMMIGSTADAQVRHRADRRAVIAHNAGYSPREMRQINFAKKQLQREIIMAKADGMVTFREQRAIDRKKRDLNRMMYISKNNRMVRR